MMVKKIAFTVYPVKDMARARRFYEEGLGMTLSTSPHDVWVEYDPPGGGCFALTTVPTMKSSSTEGGLVAFEVDDVDGLTERLRALGIPVKAEPFSSPVCRMSVVVDPEGNAVLLHQITKEG
jgi:predicted enzyme related to lactoylglutathione lyase